MVMISPFLLKLVNNREKCGNCVVLQHFQLKGKRSLAFVWIVCTDNIKWHDFNWYELLLCLFLLNTKVSCAQKQQQEKLFLPVNFFCFYFFKRKFSSFYFYAHCFFCCFFLNKVALSCKTLIWTNVFK